MSFRYDAQYDTDQGYHNRSFYTPEYHPPRPQSNTVGKIVGVAFLTMIGLAITLCITGSLLLMPQMNAQQRRGNETHAIGVLRTLTTAQTIFSEAEYGDDNYGTLEDLIDAGLLDTRVAEGPIAGYVFRCELSDVDDDVWWATATPRKPGSSGDRYFYINHEGVVYSSLTKFNFIPDDGSPPAGAQPLER